MRPSDRVRDACKRWGVLGLVERELRRKPSVSWGVFVNTRARLPHIVTKRHRIWALVRDELKVGYSETARLFGVDHTTIMSAVKKAKTTP